MEVMEATAFFGCNLNIQLQEFSCAKHPLTRIASTCKQVYVD